jgi:hypothetical protein
MLRASGRSGKLTDNFDACRDLQGRRIRHQEADKRLAQWAAEEQQRDLERIAQAHIKKQAKEERQKEIERVRRCVIFVKHLLRWPLNALFICSLLHPRPH